MKRLFGAFGTVSASPFRSVAGATSGPRSATARSCSISAVARKQSNDGPCIEGFFAATLEKHVRGKSQESFLDTGLPMALSARASRKRARGRSCSSRGHQCDSEARLLVPELMLLAASRVDACSVSQARSRLQCDGQDGEDGDEYFAGDDPKRSPQKRKGRCGRMRNALNRAADARARMEKGRFQNKLEQKGTAIVRLIANPDRLARGWLSACRPGGREGLLGRHVMMLMMRFFRYTEMQQQQQEPLPRS